jgi:hypothetical protein
VAIDERIEALTMNLELAHRDIQELTVLAQKEGENIRPLARIAEIHKRRLRAIEGDEAWHQTTSALAAIAGAV